MMVAFFFLFGVVAVSLWQGNMHQRCFTAASGLDPAVPADWLCGGMHGCPASSTCLDKAPNGFISPAPAGGLLHYDDLVGTTRVLYTTVLLEGWTQALAWVQDTQVSGLAIELHAVSSQRFYPPLQGLTAWIFFVAVIVIGSFLLVNVFLANIMSSYSAGRSRLNLRAARTHARQQAIRRMRAYVKFHRRKSAIEGVEQQRKALRAVAAGESVRLRSDAGLQSTRSRTGSLASVGRSTHRTQFFSKRPDRSAPPRHKSLPWALPQPQTVQSSPSPKPLASPNTDISSVALHQSPVKTFIATAHAARVADTVTTHSSAAQDTLRQRRGSSAELTTAHVPQNSREKDHAAVRRYLRRMSQDVHMARAAHIADSIIAAGFGEAMAAVDSPEAAIDEMNVMGRRRDPTTLFDKRLVSVAQTIDERYLASDPTLSNPANASTVTILPAPKVPAPSRPRDAVALPADTAAGIERVGRRVFAELHRTQSMLMKNGHLGLDGAATRPLGGSSLGPAKAERDVQRLHDQLRAPVGHPSDVPVGNARVLETVSHLPQTSRTDQPDETGHATSKAHKLGVQDFWSLREGFVRRVEDWLCPPRQPVVLMWKS